MIVLECFGACKGRKKKKAQMIEWNKQYGQQLWTVWFSYFGDETRGWKLIPQGSGRHSACPPAAARILL